jgi:hypothetical protein
MASRLLANPKNCCHDACFPRVFLRRPSNRRFSDALLIFFSDTFGLRSEGNIKSDEKREAKRGNSAVFPHHISNGFPFKHCVKREDLLGASRVYYNPGRDYKAIISCAHRARKPLHCAA